jgi:inward rectifier potassium channel
MAQKNTNILKDEFEDLGFSSLVNGNSRRLINSDGSFNILRGGAGAKRLNVYQWLVLMSWKKFFLMVILFYLSINFLFAFGYWLIGVEQLAHNNLNFHPFWIGFFFSAQTLTTVGYGGISPVGFGANVLATIGALVGLLSFALATGLLFSRFSRPSANIRYSKVALIAPYANNQQALMFRIVNNRKNVLADLQALMIMTWVETDANGRLFRQYRTIELEREFLPMMPINWTIVHPINEKSPFNGWDKTSCQRQDIEFLVIVQAYDETFSNIVRSYNSYRWEELVWDAKFKPMFYTDEDGNTVLELDKLSNYETLSGEVAG